MPNLLENSFEVFAKAHKRETGQVPDGPSFVGGFATLLGVLSGRVNVGMPDATVQQLFDLAHQSLVDYRQSIIDRAQAERMKQGEIQWRMIKTVALHFLRRALGTRINTRACHCATILLLRLWPAQECSKA